MRSHGRALVVVVAALLAFFAFAAQAMAAYTQVGTFAEGTGTGGSGGGNGELSNPGQAALNVSTGKLYVADTGNGRVEVFRPTETSGEFDSIAWIGEPTGVAVDQASGDVYVATSSGIAKYDSGLNPIVLGWTDPGVTGTLAVDPISGDLLVADRDANLVRRFDSDGTADGSFAAERPISIAANSAGEIFVVTSTGDVNLDCSATSTVRRYDAGGTETGTVGPSLSAPGSVAVDLADDSIAVAAPVNQYNCGSQRPQVVRFDSGGSELEALELTGNTLYATVPGLASATFADASRRIYAVTKSPGNDAFGNTKVTVFEVPPPPSLPVVTLAAGFPTSTEANLTAVLNPGHDVTRYHFEYGASSSYGQASAERVLSASGKNVPVQQKVTGLAPGSTYHFRLVATNSAGTTDSGDIVFTTSPRQAATDSCPNAAIRTAQKSSQLPECRAYEMVSPADKSNGIIAFPAGIPNSHTSSRGAVTAVSPDGELAAFWSYQAFGDAKSGAVQSYRAARTPDGWATHAWTPPMPDTPVTPKLNDWAFVAFATDDLSKGYIRTPAPFDPLDQRPRDPSFEDQYYDIYGVEPDGSVSWESRPDGSGPDSAASVSQLVGLADDGSATLFETREQMTPNAADQVGGDSVYLREKGRTILLAAEEGASAVSTCGASLRDPTWGGGGNGGLVKPSAVSPDASRVFFTAPDPAAFFEPRAGSQPSSEPACAEPPQVYVRDHGKIAMASASQRAVPDSPARARFEDATADGSSVFFTSNAALTEDADPSKDGMLYRYDVESEKLTLLTPEGGVERLIAISDDGSHLYYVVHSDLYVDVEGAITEVADLTGPADNNNTPEAAYWVQSVAPVRVAPDGRFLAFQSHQSRGVFQHPKVTEIYRYDSVTKALTCISCNRNGMPPLGDASFTSSLEAGAAVAIRRDPRNMSADGSRIAFDTVDSLVPRDQNERTDVYEWVDGDLHLISDGTSKDGSFLFDVDADRSDIFFATSSSLVGQDIDRGAQDIYDARIDGGFAEETPQTRACSGEECQGEAGVSGPGSTLATGLSSGPGNASGRKAQSKPRCGKGKKAVRKRGKTRCATKGRTAKKKSAKQRRANDNRRAAR